MRKTIVLTLTAPFVAIGIVCLMLTSVVRAIAYGPKVETDRLQRMSAAIRSA